MRRPFAFEETEKQVELKVITYCPEKWLLVDQETGQIFRGNVGGYWDRVDPVTKEK